MASPSLSTTKTAGAHGGFRAVNYVNVKGRSMTALVYGGSAASLNLFVPQLPVANRRKTAIAKRTTMGQTNVWWS